MVECLKERNVNALKETFKLPAVIGLGDTKVAYRDVSCYCDICTINDLCPGWTDTRRCLKKKGSLQRNQKKFSNSPPPPPPHPITFAPNAHTSGGTEIVPNAMRENIKCREPEK